MSNERRASTHAGLAWFKSSYSDSEGANCVEVATGSGAVHVRDSKDRQGAQLAFTQEEWSNFVAFAVKS
ncbi:DUF397 domain-containing protein [Streptomyces sp. NPDC004647]|uniref:DUF397 domain-containing protein n=1 Tax=Streptomyces sp. NPDC004647 TaxID=3154671 RepID=UPI0033A9828B